MTTTVLESEKDHVQQILNILQDRHPIRDEDFASLSVAKESKDAFRVLVVTILSQNCTDIAAIRAFKNLDQQVGVTIPKLSQANVSQIQRAIRIAGLHRQKAKALKRLAQVIAKRYSNSFENLLEGPFEVVRGRLQDLPKVGPKTADVLLSLWGRPTISVDTHVNRVSKRLGLAPRKAKYDEIRASLMRLFDEEEYRFVPLLFIAHGRRVCKARKPLCPTCPIEKLCPYPGKTPAVVR